MTDCDFEYERRERDESGIEFCDGSPRLANSARVVALPSLYEWSRRLYRCTMAALSIFSKFLQKQIVQKLVQVDHAILSLSVHYFTCKKEAVTPSHYNLSKFYGKTVTDYKSVMGLCVGTKVFIKDHAIK